MSAQFRAHPLAPGGQLQTLLAFIKPNARALKADEYVYVPVSQADEVELLVNHPKGEVKGIVYMLHGLGGDASSPYKVRIAQKLVPQGYRVIRHNHRGNSEVRKASKGLYHSGSAADILKALEVIQKKWPGTPIVAIGFSLSGTMLLNLLGWYHEELKKIPELKAAMSVCSPLDLQKSSDSIASPRNKHIDYFFAKSVLAHLKKRELITNAEIKSKFKKPTLRKVDEYVTAPFGGFRDAADYYARCSPWQVLEKIEIPTLILAAKDDPIVPAESVQGVKHSQAVTIQMEPSGGHMGFLSRDLTPHKDYRWMDYFIETWAKRQLGHAEAKA